MLLEVERLPVEAQCLEFAMRCDEQSPTRRFVRSARFDPYQAILHHVHPADAVFRRDIVQRFEQCEPS